MLTLDRVIDAALQEDIHTGDVTTQSLLLGDRPMKAKLIAKADFVLAGISVAGRVFDRVDADTHFSANFADGARVLNGDIIATVQGQATGLLMGERVALNLLQRLSGIATVTSKFVKAVRGTNARIVDTRKTTPGLRELEKYAVRMGGAHNHRTGLYDGVLIKENHIKAAGGVGEAIRRAKVYAPHTLKIEIEAENLTQVEDALLSGADVIMLDNMSLDDMRSAVAMVAGRVPLEASGGVNLDTVRAIAETGVNIISVGALTHSPQAVDISMLIQ